MCLRISIDNFFLQSQEASWVCQCLILKGAHQKVFSYLFKKEKPLTISQYHSRVHHYLWWAMWTIYCTVSWISFVLLLCDFPQERLKGVTSLKIIATWPPFYLPGFLKHVNYGAHYDKWIKKHHHTDVSAERFSNLLNIISSWIKGWRSIEYFINWMASFSTGSQRAVSWSSDILQFSPMLYKGWSVFNEYDREEVNLYLLTTRS